MCQTNFYRVYRRNLKTAIIYSHSPWRGSTENHFIMFMDENLESVEFQSDDILY